MSTAAPWAGPLKVPEAPIDDDGDDDDHNLPVRFYLPLKAHEQTKF